MVFIATVFFGNLVPYFPGPCLGKNCLLYSRRLRNTYLDRNETKVFQILLI